MISAPQRLALARQHSYDVRFHLSVQAAFVLLLRIAVAAAETVMLLRAPQYYIARYTVIVLLDLFLIAPLTLGFIRNVAGAQTDQLLHWFGEVKLLFDAAITAAFFWLEQILHAVFWFSVLQISSFFMRQLLPQWALSVRLCIIVLWVFCAVALLLRRLSAFVVAATADACTLRCYLSARRHHLAWQEIGSIFLAALSLVFFSLFLPLLPRNMMLFFSLFSNQIPSICTGFSNSSVDLSQTQVFAGVVPAKNT